MKRPNQYQFEWITDWESIYSDAFQQQWLQWYHASESNHVFFHPTLSIAWIDTYRPIRDIEPIFCIARKGNSTVFLPLIYWKRNWKNAFQRLIVPVGYSDFDYHDPLIENVSTDCLTQFYVEFNQAVFEVITFDKLYLNGIRTFNNNSGWRKEEDYCPFCEISEFKNPDEYISSLKTGLRGDIKRQIRRMQELGEVSINVFSKTTIDNALNVLPEFLAYHRKRWPSAYKAPNLHKLLIERGVAAGIVDFSELRVGDKTISRHLGFVDHGRYYYYMPVIDPDFAAFSPGKIHLLFLVNLAIEKKLSIFDHLRGAENYKSGWTNQIQPLFCYSSRTSKPVGVLRNWIVDRKNNVVK